MKRLVMFLLFLLLLAGGGYFAWKWYFEKQVSVEGMKLIPEDAVFIVETNEPVEGWKTFSKSPMWQHIKNFKPLGEIGSMADGITATVEDNGVIFSVFGHRNVLISAHVTQSDDYDFLYVCDMEKGGKFSTVKDGIINLLKRVGYRYSQSQIGETGAHHFYDPTDKSTLNLAFVANQLVCSYNAILFRKSIEKSTDTEFTPDPLFTEVASGTASDGLCRIYLNHKYLPEYLNVYMSDVSGIRGLFASMHYTGVSAEMTDEQLSFKGFTNINDSMSSYLRALHRSGNSRTRAQEVLSDQTAFMLSMGFRSFGKFYENLKEVMKEDEKSWKEFNKNKKTVEILLRFSLEDDLMSWIDDEVTLAQYHQDRVVGGKVHSVVAIKALSEEKAKDKLGKITSRLKLFGKFKTQTYKEHEVHYMEVRGLFNLLFGKLFGKIEKPYYTMLDDYVVFCDDPKTLLNTIDDFEAKKTLSQSEEYSKFNSTFKRENSLLVYLNMKKYFLNLKGILDGESYTESYNNREYIICFPQMGFQFSADETLFDTRLAVQFKKPDEYDMEITEGKALNMEELEVLDTISDADAFIMEFISGSVKKEVYDNGKVKILAEMDAGQLHGRYLEYWETGAMKVKGRYKHGEKSGRWYFYKETGELDRRERFRNGGGEPMVEIPEPI